MINEIKTINDEVLREISIVKLSEETKLSIEFIKDKVGEKKKIDEVIITPKENNKLTKFEKSERNLVYYMLKYPNAIKMYDKKITYMPTEKYRHLAFQINTFYKKYGYITIADILTELRDDSESIKTIGELETLNLRDEYDSEEIDDYLENIRVYNEQQQANKYKNELKKEVDFNRKIELANKLIENKLRSEENDRGN